MLSSSMKNLRCPEGDKIFAACDDGCLYELSMKHGKVVRNFGQVFNNSYISSMTTTIDNKTLFVNEYGGKLRELAIRTNKLTNHFGIKNVRHCLLQHLVD